MEPRPRVFISYAREDDEPFAKRLYHDLVAAGFDVWRDREAMPSRGRTFLQEIRDEIAEVDRVVAIIGPKAIESETVRYEWDSAHLFAKPIVPILRLGDYDLLPAELLPEPGDGLADGDFSKLHCPDFRETRAYEEALAELLRILREPVPALGPIPGVPALPPHFLVRREYIERLRETVLADVQRPTVITPEKRTVTLHGMGGIGKSVLAAAFAHSLHTRRAFEHGIFWLTAGEEATNLTLLENMRALGSAFDDDAHYVDEKTARVWLPEVLEDKACLIILDNVWSIDQVDPFRNALGPRCRLLVTTRDRGPATSLGAQEHRVDVLTTDQALALLAEWSETTPDRLPEEARQVADECGNLPFALTLCGAMAREGTPWADLLESLKKADLTFIEKELSNYPYPNVFKALKVSVDLLAREDPDGSKQYAYRYQQLAVYSPGRAVPKAAVLTLWSQGSGLEDRYARRLLDILARKSLLRVEGKAPNRLVSMHDLQHDYLRASVPDRKKLHRNLLEAYSPRCPTGWPSGPDDGYFFQHLPHHLVEAGEQDELGTLLFDLEWIAAKLNGTNIAAVIADYELVPGDKSLKVVKQALVLSAHVLAQDASQLASQLVGRLRGVESPEIREFARKADRSRRGAWLRPETPSLAQAGGPLLRTFVGQTSRVNAVVALADGRRVLSSAGYPDGALRLWNLETGEELLHLEGHCSGTTAVAVLPDGRHALSGSEDALLRLWDLETGRELRHFEGHEYEVTAVTILADGRHALSASYDATLRLWDLTTGDEIRRLEGHGAPVKAVALMPDGRYAVSGSEDNTIRLWDLKSGSETRRFEGHTRSVTAVAVLADGRRLFSGSSDGTLRLWNRGTGKELRRYESHSSSKITISVPPTDGRSALSGSRHSTENVQSGRGVSAATVLADGRRALSGTYDGVLQLWELESGAELGRFQGHTDTVSAIAVTNDCRRAVSGSSDKTIRLWDLEVALQPRRIERHAGPVTAVAAIADRNQVLSGSKDCTMRLWDINTGAQIRTFKGHTAPVKSLAVLPGSRHVVSGGGDMGMDPTMRLWDLETSAELRCIKGHDADILAMSILPDGRRLLSASWDRTLRLWDLETGKELRRFEGHTVGVMAVAVLPDGRRALSGSWDSTLRLWNMETGAELRQFLGHVASIQAVAVLADGRHALSGSLDRTLRLWDLETGGELQRFVGHTNGVMAVAVFGDGCRAVSGSLDQTLRLWDLQKGEVITTFTGEAAINSVAVVRDNLFVAGSENGVVHILRLKE